MAWEPSSSVGFGGTVPDESTLRRRPWTQGRVKVHAADQHVGQAVLRALTPSPEEIDGRRRSQSTTTVDSPARAVVTARFPAVVVLPSPADELVTMTERTVVEIEELQAGAKLTEFLHDLGSLPDFRQRGPGKSSPR